ncbi:MAG: hypothetical protein ABSF83_11875 [Nitrososphaerales archaeon]|jgi:hypothetical protein
MLDLTNVAIAYAFGVLGIVGIVCVDTIIKMFKGDVMEQLFKFMVVGFALITLVGFGDAVLLTVGQQVPSGILSAALMVFFALLLIGLVRLIQWNEGSKASTVVA